MNANAAIEGKALNLPNWKFMSIYSQRKFESPQCIRKLIDMWNSFSQVAASRVKAHKTSKRLPPLMTASKGGNISYSLMICWKKLSENQYMHCHYSQLFLIRTSIIRIFL